MTAPVASPASADLSANSPAMLLGDPSAVQPPQIGVGRRGRGARPSLDLLRGKGGNLSSKTPRAPGAPKTREEVKAGLHVVRPQERPAAPAPRPAPKDGRERTPAGAPIERQREIPKTGAAEAERDAWREVIGKDPARFHGGIGAKAQDQMNKLLRNKARIATRRGNETLEELFKTMRREDDEAEWKRKHPDRGGQGGGASTGQPPPPPDSAPSRPPEAQERRKRNWRDIDETLGAIRGNKPEPAGQPSHAPANAAPTVQRVVIPKEEDDEQP